MSNSFPPSGGQVATLAAAIRDPYMVLLKTPKRFKTFLKPVPSPGGQVATLVAAIQGVPGVLSCSQARARAAAAIQCLCPV